MQAEPMVCRAPAASTIWGFSSAVAAAMHRAAMSISGTKGPAGGKILPQLVHAPDQSAGEDGLGIYAQGKGLLRKSQHLLLLALLENSGQGGKNVTGLRLDLWGSRSCFCGAKLRRGTGGRLKVGRWSRAL